MNLIQIIIKAFSKLPLKKIGAILLTVFVFLIDNYGKDIVDYIKKLLDEAAKKVKAKKEADIRRKITKKKATRKKATKKKATKKKATKKKTAKKTVLKGKR